MQEILKQKQKLRLTVLHKLYEMSGGDIHAFVNGGQLAEACEISDESTFKTAADYLEGEYLVEIKRLMGGIPALLRIKHEGIIEVESAFLKPDEPTEHFMPVNVLYVNQMIGSAVQQGTTNSTQTANIQIDIGAKDQLRHFVEIASKALEAARADTPQWREMRSDVDTLRAQVESPSPKRSIIKECLSSLGRLCEGSTAGAVGTQLATYIPQLLALFG